MLIFIFFHRAVDISGLALAIAGGLVRLGHIHRLQGHNRRGRIVKVQIILSHTMRDISGQAASGQRAAGYDDNGFFRRRNLPDFLMMHCNERMAADLFRDITAEALPVYGKSTACRYTRRVSGLQNDGIQPAHLFLQHAHSILKPRSPERITADELGKASRLVRRC